MSALPPVTLHLTMKSEREAKTIIFSWYSQIEYANAPPKLIYQSIPYISISTTIFKYMIYLLVLLYFYCCFLLYNP